MKQLLFFIVLFVNQNIYTQEKQTIHRNEQWVEYYSQFFLNNKYKIILDVGGRWRDNLNTGIIYFTRIGLDYSLDEKINFQFGFTYVGYFLDNKKTSLIEYRPYQEFSLKNNYKSTKILQRIRVEERFFEPRSSNYQSSFNWRFRYMLMLDIPLFKFSKDNPNHRVSLGLGDEIFFNAGKRIVHNHFDQNRLLLSPTFHFGENLNIGITWSNQYASTNIPENYIHSQVIWFQIRQNFKFD